MHTSSKIPLATTITKKKEFEEKKKQEIKELRKLKQIVREKIAQRGIDIKELFEKFDSNGDGNFSLMEFECAFNALGIEVAKADLRRFIKITDANRDGRVDFKEFYDVLHSEDLDESEIERAGLGESQVDFDASFEDFD